MGKDATGRSAVAEKQEKSGVQEQQQSSSGVADFVGNLWGKSKDLAGKGIDAVKPLGEKALDAGKEGVAKVKEMDKKTGLSKDVTEAGKAYGTEMVNGVKKGDMKTIGRLGVAAATGGTSELVIGAGTEIGGKVLDKQVKRNGSHETQEAYNTGKKVLDATGAKTIGKVVSGDVGGAAMDVAKKAAVNQIKEDPQGSMDAVKGVGSKMLGGVKGLFHRGGDAEAKEAPKETKEAAAKTQEGVGEVRKKGADKAPANEGVGEVRKKDTDHNAEKRPKW